MKTRKIIALGLAATMLALAAPAQTDNEDAMSIVADVAIVRPGCLIATVLGSAIFVVSLPFGLTSKSVKKTAYTLVSSPAKATFTRPLGDMDVLSDY